MTPGQELACEQAVCNLNNAGYFWMDNTTSNFSFERLPGEDRWRVVIIDSAGIYPVREVKGVSKAEVAKMRQKVLSDCC